jgi:predicted DNA-binding protein
MKLLRRKRGKYSDVSSRQELGEKSVYGGIQASLSRQHKELYERFKALSRQRGFKTSTDAIVWLIQKYLREGGDSPPSETDIAIEQTTAVIQMAQTSGVVVREMLEKQIESYQRACEDAHAYYLKLQEQIRTAESRLMEINKQISDQEFEFQRKKQSADAWENQKRLEQQSLVDEIRTKMTELQAIEEKLQRVRANR